jgi:hypothetical protein
MLTGAAVAAAATAVGAPQLATPAAADVAQDVADFVKLSAAITGIDATRIAPSVDPVDVKSEYFVVASRDPAFGALLQIVHNNADFADKVMNNPDPAIKFLGRAIILAWYTGCWYPPKTLQAASGNSPVDPQGVISAAAYTQGWNWRVGQTHPMGYSEWRFGYWHEDPPPLSAFINAQK